MKYWEIIADHLGSLKAHSAYENRERRLIASNQTKSAISEFRVQPVCQFRQTASEFHLF
jgi:hypothetical protein